MMATSFFSKEKMVLLYMLVYYFNFGNICSEELAKREHYIIDL